MSQYAINSLVVCVAAGCDSGAWRSQLLTQVKSQIAVGEHLVTAQHVV